jgi:hypothetical protein
MAGLSDLITNTAQQTTTLPSWFDTAQQNVVNQATNVLNQAPAPQNTVGQNAVNQLQDPNNAFSQASGTLQNIATGAANPFMTDPTTGQVSPNTSTALGGLFAAQNQQLNQMMPYVQAPVEGANIASGNFGGMRGQQAVNAAKANAIANMNAAQYQAALQNQATGVNAAQGVGNVEQQEINNLLNVGQYQQAAPFSNISNYGKILGGIQAPTTVRNQTQLSPLNQVGSILGVLQGPTGSGGLLGAAGVQGGLGGLLKSAGNLAKEAGYGIYDTLTGARTYTGPSYGTNPNFDNSFFDTNSFD